MSSTVYALLVGIDQYQKPVPPLSGCVADIDAMKAFLEARIPPENLRVETLRNEQATYTAVTERFLNHLGKAGKDDVALFYYGGHGSQAPTAEAFWHVEPDRLDETLVCYDSRVSGHFDLADKEMSKLIAEVAKQDPHVVVILDSCHSGSATRDIESVGVRRAPTDERPRPLSTYLVTPSELEQIGSTRSGRDLKSDWLSLPGGRHVADLRVSIGRRSQGAALRRQDAWRIFILSARGASKHHRKLDVSRSVRAGECARSHTRVAAVAGDRGE